MPIHEFGQVIRGVTRATQFAREYYGEPDLSEKAMAHWIATGKVRSRRFGGQVTFKTDEMVQDLAGIPHEPPVVAA